MLGTMVLDIEGMLDILMPMVPTPMLMELTMLARDLLMLSLRLMLHIFMVLMDMLDTMDLDMLD